MRKRRIFTALAIGLTTAAGLLISPTTASAHEVRASIHFCGPEDNNRCGYGGVTTGHRRFYACDTFADGAGFRTVVRLRNGDTRRVDDANGAETGCSDKRTLRDITGYRVISKDPSGWRYRPSRTGWFST